MPGFTILPNLYAVGRSKVISPHLGKGNDAVWPKILDIYCIMSLIKLQKSVLRVLCSLFSFLAFIYFLLNVLGLHWLIII